MNDNILKMDNILNSGVFNSDPNQYLSYLGFTDQYPIEGLTGQYVYPSIEYIEFRGFFVLYLDLIKCLFEGIYQCTKRFL
jgi:hypothetical protein